MFEHGWLPKVTKVYYMDMELADFTLKDYIKYVFEDAPLPNVSTPSFASSTL
jgi:hypothetical protein